MEHIRTIRKIIRGKKIMEGAGVKLVRVLGHDDTKELDPFLLLDVFDSKNPDEYIKGFPWHPHRGIETITYLIQGEIEHGDSLGNKGSIRDGECQWMTAGSGIIHQEMPQVSKRLLGVQLWLNLPSKSKMGSPKYRSISKEEIPVVDEGDKKIHILAGTYHGRVGLTQGDYVKILYLDVELDPLAEWLLPTEKAHTLFIYILQGATFVGTPGDLLIKEKHAIVFHEGSEFKAKASEHGVRFLLWSGKPLHQSIVWNGSIVMNTQEELDLAFKELEEKTFIK